MDTSNSTSIHARPSHPPDFGGLQGGCLPFGEILLEEKAQSAWVTPYKFNCKELDAESSLYYYGARYYDPKTCVWLGVDPMSDKYPGLSPFVYCANNPVILIDPDGREVFICGDDGVTTIYTQGMKYEGKDKFTQRTVNALNKINGKKTGTEMVGELVNSENAFNIQSGTKSGFSADNQTQAYASAIVNAEDQTACESYLNNGINLDKGSGGTITWNSDGTELPTTAMSSTNSTMDLAHEMFHGLDANRGMLDDREVQGIGRSEWQSCFRENTLRGEFKLPLRTQYSTVRDANGRLMHGSGPRLLNSGKPFIPFYYTR